MSYGHAHVLRRRRSTRPAVEFRALGQNARMPLIQISQTTGLTAEQKRATIEAVTKAYAEATGKDPAKVWVTIADVPAENWGVGGSPLG
jgi:4-oxalocrotonate tautomerase